MQRIAVNSPGTLASNWYVDGVLTDPSSAPTVTIVRANGTAIVTAAPTTKLAVGVYQYTLSAAQNALLDKYTVTWTSPNLGAQTTQAEIVGGFLFPLADLRQRLSDTGLYPATNLVDARTRAEQDLEDACGVAFVPRYTRERHSVRGPHRGLVLEQRFARVVRDATINGVPVVGSDLTGLELDTEGGLIRPWSFGSAGWWTTGFGLTTVDVGYEYGMDAPPGDVYRGALDLATTYAQDAAAVAATSAINPRATSIATADGTINLATARPIDAPFAIPTADAVVNRYGLWGFA